MKKSHLRQLIKEIVVEVLSNEDKNARTEHFWIKFGEPDLIKGAGKIFLGEEWFANAIQVAKDWNPKVAGKWYINRHTGAFKLKLPVIEKHYNTVQELLNDLEKWYSTTIIKK